MSDLTTTKPRTLSTTLADRIARYKQRTGTFLLLDVSSSMDGSGRERPIDRLRASARQLRQDIPTLRQIVFPAKNFNNFPYDAEEITGDIPEPRGTTPLHAAIRVATALGALHLIVVSDGVPDDEQAAARAARESKCKIDVVYVGMPGGHGEAFLRQLAQAHGGSSETISLHTQQLETKIRGLLNAKE
jgi:Mg-chelatase subunit ChlD